MRKNVSDSGFTLVETMIAVAVLGGLAIVGMNLTKTQTKSTAKMSFDSEMIFIVNEINGILSDPNKCQTTLGGKNALSTTAGINSINGNKYFSQASGSDPANGYGNASIHIASYALNSTAANVASNNSALLINFQNKNLLKGQAGAPTITKRINLYVDVDSSNSITKCRSLSSASTDIWTRGTGSDIYYGGGNIGAGTSAPTLPLHVSGSIQNILGVESTAIDTMIQINNLTSTGNLWKIISTGKGSADPEGHFGIQYGGHKPTADSSTGGTVLSIDPAGNVGIGTVTPQAMLEVNGVIRTSQRNNSYGGVPISTLTGFHPGCTAGSIQVSGTSGDPNSWSFSANCVSGCNRFCQDKKYSGGTITEYNGASQQAECLCSP